LPAAPEVEGVTGGYFAGRKAAPSSPASRDEEAARRLWQRSGERNVRCDRPGITDAWPG